MEDFATFEQSIKLKKLGYNWKGYWFYRKDGLIGDEHPDIPSFASWQNYNDPEVAKHFDVECSAPTLAEAQKWLREEKHIFIIITCDYHHDWRNIIKLPTGHPLKTYGYHARSKEEYLTYELALSSAIDKALELLS